MMMITRKRKLILQLLSSSGEISKLRFVKMMFSISKNLSSYNFVPYHYGPFSFELYRDLNWLMEKGFVVEDGGLALTEKGMDIVDKNIDHFILKDRVKEKLELSDKDLIDEIYDENPWYTIFSKYKKKEIYSRNETGLISIGYEKRSVDEFLNELLKEKVQVLLDVRKNPFSRKFGFSKKKLIDYCGKLGIEYQHYPELGIDGARRKDLNTYEDYQRLFREYDKGLDEKMEIVHGIIDIAKEKKIAMFCFERDPIYCHRNVIIERIRRNDLEVKDI
jgi:uncharacterized protein (DUF488 family)